MNLKEECNNLKLKHTQLETKINSNENTINELLEDKKKQEENLQQVEEKLSILREKTNVEDFITKNTEINKIENEREEIEKVIKSYRNRIDELNIEKEEARNNLNYTDQELAKINTTLDEKNKVREENLLKIKSKVEDIDNIEEILNKVQKEMKIIEDNYIFTEKAKEEADKNYEECNSKLISITSKGKELYKRKEEEKQKLDMALKEEGF